MTPHNEDVKSECVSCRPPVAPMLKFAPITNGQSAPKFTPEAALLPPQSDASLHSFHLSVVLKMPLCTWAIGGMYGIGARDGRTKLYMRSRSCGASSQVWEVLPHQSLHATSPLVLQLLASPGCHCPPRPC